MAQIYNFIVVWIICRMPGQAVGQPMGFGLPFDVLGREVEVSGEQPEPHDPLGGEFVDGHPGELDEGAVIGLVLEVGKAQEVKTETL